MDENLQGTTTSSTQSETPVHAAASRLHEMVKEGHRVYEQALAYAALGFKLIPIVPGIKTPAIKTGEDHLDGARTDTKTLTEWFDHKKPSEIGVVLGAGSGVLVVDVDGPAGEKSLLELEAQLGVELPKDGPRSKTPREDGGYHLWFRYPSGMVQRIKSRPIGDKLDIKADGGYCVAPPSRGRSWVVPLSADLPELPTAWIDFLSPKAKHEAPPPSEKKPDWQPKLLPGGKMGLVLGEPVHEGARNTSLTKVAGKFRHLGCDADEIFEQLQLHNDTFCDPPLDEEEVWNIAKSVTRYEPGGLEGFDPSDAGLPVIDISRLCMVEMSERAWSALVSANTASPELFRSAQGLVRIVTESSSGARIEVLTPDSFAYHLNRCATWIVRQNGRAVQKHAPKNVIADMLAEPNPPLPYLERLVFAPVVCADGTLHTEPGYNLVSQCYYAPPDHLSIPGVSPKPTTEEVDRAKKLLYELIADFPFAGGGADNPERCHALALMMQPFAYELFGGLAPLSLIEAATPGSGKSLLARALLMPSIGPELSMMAEGRDDEEWRKRLTAVLRTYPMAVVVDNVKTSLKSPVLAAALTAKTWDDRLLGKSEIVKIPVKCSFVATGNNPALTSEISRRVYRIRLVAKEDHPWLRPSEKFKHPNLMLWAAENRGRLIWACLTLIQNWLAKGRPKAAGSRSLGMFEGWSQVMGGILDSAGIKGFLGNLDEFYESTDTETSQLQQFVHAWHARHNTKAVGAKDLYALVSGDPPEVVMDLGNGSDQSRRVRLGNELQKMKDRHIGGFKVVRAGKQKGATLWKLEMAQGESPNTDSPQTHPQEMPILSGSSESGESSESFTGKEEIISSSISIAKSIANTELVPGDSPDSPSNVAESAKPIDISSVSAISGVGESSDETHLPRLSGSEYGDFDFCMD